MIFVNPVMGKVAALIIFEPIVVEGSQNGKVMCRTSVPGSVLIKTTLVKSLQWHYSVPDGDQVLRAYYTSGKVYGNSVLQATLPEAKRPQCMASAFLRKCASLQLDLISPGRHWVPGSFMNLI